MNSSADHRPLSARALHKSFSGTVALDDFTLEAESGRLLTVLGPSAAGKTTALRILAGFELPDSGTVRVNGQTVNRPRRIRSPRTPPGGDGLPGLRALSSSQRGP